MTARTSTSLSESLNRAGARCVVFEGSEFLFLERTDDTDPPLSKETISELSTLNSVASEDSVVMLDDKQRVEVLVGLTQLADMSINDFSKIRTIGLVPQLTHRLGTWKRRKKIRDGFWSVDFETPEGPDETIRQMLESRILKPWSARRKVHSCFIVPSNFETLLPDFKPDLISFDKHLHGAAVWECKFVTTDHVVRSDHESGLEPNHYALIKWLDVGNKLIISLGQKLNPVVDFEAGDTLRIADQQRKELVKAGVTTSGISTRFEPDEQSAETNVDNNVVIEKVQSATDALDAVLLSLTAPPGNTSIPPSPRRDPVRNAIAIRARLQQSVNFVDSATWAKARGIRSNPSAALGKYKQKGRIFSVRSGRGNLYPSFQFAENNAEPLPVVEKILQAVPKEEQGWPLLSWFEAKNVLLNDRKPSEVLASEPDAVLRAAVRFYSRDD